MSSQWSANDRAERLTARNEAILAEGRCAHCQPHRGENQHSHDGRFIDGKFVPSKSKEKK